MGTPQVWYHAGGRAWGGTTQWPGPNVATAQSISALQMWVMPVWSRCGAVIVWMSVVGTTPVVTHPQDSPCQVTTVLIIQHWVLWFASMEHSTHDSFLINEQDINSKSNSKRKEEILLSLWVGTKKKTKRHPYILNFTNGSSGLHWTLLTTETACEEKMLSKLSKSTKSVALSPSETNQ